MRRFNIWTCMDVVGRSCQCDPAPDSPGHLRHCNLVSQHQQQISSNYFLTFVVAGAWQVTKLGPTLCWASHEPSPCYRCPTSDQWLLSLLSGHQAVAGAATQRQCAGAGVDTWSQLITNTATMESWPITTTLYRGYDWIQHFTLSHLIISGSYCPRPKPSEPE